MVPDNQRSDSTSKTRGLIIGRFLPPHRGHELLIEVAREATDHLDVMVCTLSHEPIPGTLRARWMAESFPGVCIIHVTEEIPAAARGQAAAAEIWADAIRRRLATPPTHVFASETYGGELAEALDATFVPVDPPRAMVPVSAAQIRRDPFGMWQYILPACRPYFTFRVLVSGPSDAERWRRATFLADALGTVAVPDYGTRLSGPHTAADRERIQAASQRAAERRSNGMVILAAACADPDLAPDAVSDAALSDNRLLAWVQAHARPRHGGE
jgi:HTH-type transcriptional regulator, transcriptional repressor of NAD biosynthesis genes